MFNSIRWRLPLSYAAIALLAALSLGAVLLTTLRSYYSQQELSYLTGNARGLSLELARMVEVKLPAAALKAQLQNFSFLTQAQVRLLDAEGQILADSGPPPDRPQVAALSVEIETETMGPGQMFTRPITDPLLEVAPGKDYASFIYIEQPGLPAPTQDVILTRTLVISQTGAEVEVFQWHKGEVITGTTSMTSVEPIGMMQLADSPVMIPLPPKFISMIPAVRTPYGFGLNAEVAPDGRLSNQVVRQPFYDVEGKLLGYAELTQGPAYGGEILASVAWGWAVAGSVAVVLAAGVGWLISRRLSTPLLALTEVTTRMAGGDLSVRADVVRHDEVGQLAQAFNEMAGQVEQTVTTLRRFVADAAHELHTPLTALRTNLELVADESQAAEQQGLIERAQAQVERLETLTRDLLDLSRLETGTNPANFGPVLLNTLVQTTGELYASQAEQAGVNFSLELPQQPLIVSGSEPLLRRALSNLLDNALKFTPAGGTVRVGLSRQNDGVEVRVEDSGIGIPPGDVPHLFSRFHRGRNAAAYPGSGLGLAIVKVIVDGHGGRVAVENLSPGASFRLHLPS